MHKFFAIDGNRDRWPQKVVGKKRNKKKVFYKHVENIIIYAVSVLMFFFYFSQPPFPQTRPLQYIVDAGR